MFYTLGPAASILVRCVDIYIFFFSNVVSLYFFHCTRLVCVDGALACDATPIIQSNVTIAATVEASSSLSSCRVLQAFRSLSLPHRAVQTSERRAWWAERPCRRDTQKIAGVAVASGDQQGSAALWGAGGDTSLLMNFSHGFGVPLTSIFSRSVPHPTRNFVLYSLVINSRCGVKEYATTMPLLLA